jgi:hypothetical protein
VGWVDRLMMASSAGYGAFRESWAGAAPSGGLRRDGEVGCSWERRRTDYALYWSMYLNNTYDDLSALAARYKAERSLYRYTRGCYSPSYRLVEFHATHLVGGLLDPAAGDGSEVPTALPIVGADAAVRGAVSRLWMESNWQVGKAVWARTGVICGDVGLRVRDDPAAGLVTLEVVDPATIAHAERDARGDVRRYTIRERRPDPRRRDERDAGDRRATGDVEYREEAELEGGQVAYRTYLDDRPYDWRPDADGDPVGNGAGAQPEWTAPYSFVPLFLTKHVDLGRSWGMSELEAGRAKVDEINDLGSKLHDQLRKLVEGAWLFAGMAPPAGTPSPRSNGHDPHGTPYGAPRSERDDVKVFYAGPEAKAQSLVNNVPIAEASAEIRQALDSLEDDYPELRFERLRIHGDLSGEALREARKSAAARVQERRPAYDHALTWAIKAALVIGGWRGLDGYAGLGLADWEGPRLDGLAIGRRPVFAPEPWDDVAEKGAKYVALKAATDAGLPLAVAMADLGWAAKDINEVKQLKEAAAAEMQAQLAAATPPDDIAPRPKEPMNGG